MLKEYNREELYNDYVINNLSREEMMEKYNINSLTSLKRVLSKYNILKPKINPSKEELYNLYIEQNISLSDLANKYNVSESKITTLLANYNIKKSSDLYTKNREKTMFKKYGVKSPSQSNEVKEKIKQTNLERYGVENVFQSEEVKEKIKETINKKYSVNNVMQNTDFSHKQNEAASKTILEKYGVEYFCLHPDCQKSSSGSNSKPNKKFENMLKNIEYKREYVIDNRSFDFKVENTLIEIDPSITHNSTFGYKSKKPMDKNYHLEKSRLAIKNGYRCIHIFDWDDANKVINTLKPKNKIYARKCEIREVNKVDTDLLLNENHFQGTCTGQSIRLGLYYNDNLIQIMTFGKPRYNNNYEYELVRLCTVSSYYVVGGAEKLFKHFIKTYNPKSIVSYCDYAKFSGDVYLRLGFKLVKHNSPTKHWYNLKTKKHFTETIVNAQGVDHLLKTNYGKGASNDELMIKNGFIEVYDCGQLRYEYKLQ